MRIINLLLLLFVLSLQTVVSQNMMDANVIRQGRLKKIDFYHIGVGFESGINKNWYLEPKVFIGAGSYLNHFTVDVGFGYKLYNAFGSSEKERIALYQIPFFACIHLNTFRWSSGVVYVGGEASFSLNVKGVHYIPSASVVDNDNNIGRNHMTITGVFGVRLNQWDFNLRYGYDLSPMMNQKYIFESNSYDYDYLHPSLFERSRVVLDLSYIIPF